MNAFIEADNLAVLAGKPVDIQTPSESGKGQIISRCADCKIALWSVYSGSGPAFRAIRVGTLDDPDASPPDVHIFTESKQPWVELGTQIPSFAQFYRRNEFWHQASLDRRQAALDGWSG